MTSEEIRAAVERLRGLDSYEMTTGEVVAEFMGTCDSFQYFTLALRNRLVGLLEQADPGTHVELPKDMNDEHIRLGDELEYLGYDDIWRGPFKVNELWLRSSEWVAYFNHGIYDSDSLIARCRHHHAPTVEDILHEFVDEWIEADSEGDVFAKYVARLREVMQDE